MSELPILMNIWHKCSFKKNIRPIFFLSATVNIEGVKTTLKIGGAKHILLNISEIIEDIVFVYIDEICVF